MKPRTGSELRFTNLVFLIALGVIILIENSATVAANREIKGATTAHKQVAARHLRKAVGLANPVSIRIDNSTQHQVMEGFGASLNSEVYGTTDYLTTSQRARALDALYNQVKIRTSQAPAILEAPSTNV